MSWGEMVREWQKGGACSRISYMLVLLASLLAFDFEPSSGSERIAPGGVYSVVLDEEVSDPSPTLKTSLVLVAAPWAALNPRQRDAAVEDDRPILAQWTSHFDARGPPL